MNRVYYDRYGNKKVFTSKPKIFYDDEGNKLLIDTARGIIDFGINGVVYRVNEDTCLKHIINDSSAHKEVIEKIMHLDLKTFYKIYKMLYDRYKDFNGYIMKYYEPEEIDITTMPTEYTLDNFSDISKDIETISDNNINIEDIHSENIIMNKEGITIIDVDNYDFLYDENLLTLNIQALYRLFKEIYIEHIEKYHQPTAEELIVIRRLFSSYHSIEEELNGYKYPIDYIRKESLEPIQYKMKKGV